MSILFNSVNLLAFYDLRLEPGWHLPAHTHESYHELIFLRSGRMSVETQGRWLAGSANVAIVYPQGVAHMESNMLDEPIHMYCLAWRGQGAPTWPLYRKDDEGRIEMVLKWMHEITLSHGVRGQPVLDSLLTTALIAYSADPEPQVDERLLAVRKYATDHIGDPICLDDLAGAAYLSRFHFATLFRRRVGIAPMEWLRRLRVEAAKTLLLTTTQSVSEVALQVGLGDESHFSRVFRRITGQSPSGFRLQN